jgi:hypothetical protein
MSMMRLGLWNIDHPEYHCTAPRRNRRFDEISAYLGQQDCDVYILTETNAAIDLAGYGACFSAESPYRNRSRCYESPNRYHQVGIFDRLKMESVEIEEPVNGLLCKSIWHDKPLFVYGNVVTIKDQWSKDSDKKYSDRMQEQLDVLGRLSSRRCLIGGDFNLRLGWPQKKGAHDRVKAFVNHHGWVWPTETQTETVQHVIHSPDLVADVTIDSSVRHTKGKKDRLSDHPFVLVQVQDGEPKSNAAIAKS